MISQLLSIINSQHKLTEKGAEGYDGIKIKGMTFNINSYEANGLGHVSTMSAKGFFGLMKMDTIIITPVEKDMPIYSYDRIYAFGNDKLYVELYDTLTNPVSFTEMDEIKDKYHCVPPKDEKSHWYDNVRLPQTLSYIGKKKDTDMIDELALEHMQAYINIDAPLVTDFDAKRSKTDYYVNGLLNNGGPATDIFLKEIGKERTTTLFKKVLFTE